MANVDNTLRPGDDGYEAACRDLLRDRGINDAAIDYVFDAYGFSDAYDLNQSPEENVAGYMREFGLGWDNNMDAGESEGGYLGW